MYVMSDKIIIKVMDVETNHMQIDFASYSAF